jgi:hypothetical protein
VLKHTLWGNRIQQTSSRHQRKRCHGNRTSGFARVSRDVICREVGVAQQHICAIRPLACRSRKNGKNRSISSTHRTFTQPATTSFTPWKYNHQFLNYIDFTTWGATGDFYTMSHIDATFSHRPDPKISAHILTAIANIHSGNTGDGPAALRKRKRATQAARRTSKRSVLSVYEDQT